MTVGELDGTDHVYFLEDSIEAQKYYARTDLSNHDAFETLSYSLRGNHWLTCTLTGMSLNPSMPSIGLSFGVEELMRRSRLFNYISNSQTIENDNSGNYFARAAKGLAAEFIQENNGNCDVK